MTPDQDYKNFTAHDFAIDEFFQAWVKGESTEAKAFWENWLLYNPERRNEILEARKILKLISYTEYEFPLNEKEEVWGNLKELANENEDNSRSKVSFKSCILSTTGT